MNSLSVVPRSADELTLPEDLLMEILLRMPAAYAFAFHCLSKFYRRLIYSSDFVRKHYDRQIKTRQPSVLVCRRTYSGTCCWRRSEILVDLGSTKSVPTVVPLISPDVDEEGEGAAKFVGCCRGILCYRIRNGQSTCLSLWNPSTGASRRSLAIHDSLKYTRYFLGYDAVTDDIKVVQITRGEAFGWVYSSNLDSWRRMDVGVAISTLHISSLDDAVFVEGTSSVHILCRDTDFETRMVLAFDFAADPEK